MTGRGEWFWRGNTPRRHPRSLLAAAAVLLVTALTVLGAAPGRGAAAPATAGHRAPVPAPVYAPGREIADPGVVRDGDRYYAFTTGGLAHVAWADSPRGPWSALPDALPHWPAWASGQGAVWAPDATHTSAGWVLYFAAIAKDFGGQRCVGTAVASNPAGPYQPADAPLICPILGGEDPAAGRPDQTAGVIDPYPFQASDGERYLLYKTQKSPGTIRMFPLSDDGLHGRGEVSHELVRHDDSIEAPVMVQRGPYYVLFASANWYDHCDYTTVWRRSTDMWSFADKTEHVLLDEADTGLCGPGGAAIVTGGHGPSLIFPHAWVCTDDDQPCEADPQTGVVVDPDKVRVMYAAVLSWGADGATPQVSSFLRPAPVHGSQAAANADGSDAVFANAAGQLVTRTEVSGVWKGPQKR